MKTKILKKLREHKGYISGQELCDEFQVSRTAIWKVIHQLEADGYVIEAVRNKGYRIVSCPDVLSREEIKSLLHTTWAGNEVYYYDEIDSTNTKIKQLADEGKPHGSLVVADKQSAGKGRRGRSWDSPAGTGIWMSILLRPDMMPDKAPMLTLVMAYSVGCAIRKSEELDANIKWPNDIVIAKKKVCGILTEMSAEIDYINHVVIGVGINANAMEFPDEIADKATSLRCQKGAPIKRAKLIADIMDEFEKNYADFMQLGNLSGMIKGYNELLVNRGQEVRVIQPGHEYVAQALGINELGELIVDQADGTREYVFAGEVSVRGIYDYV